MYAFFRGTVDSVESDKAVIDVNGIGYEINMPWSRAKSGSWNYI